MRLVHNRISLICFTNGSKFSEFPVTQLMRKQ